MNDGAERLNKKISIIIPALNEAHGIGHTLGAIPRKELAQMGYELQILVVDNGSTDSTPDIARQAGAEVVLEPKLGYGYAYKTGFLNATGDIIATADADATYPIEDIPKLVQTLENENLDFITTDRFALKNGSSMRPLHKVGNYVLTFATKTLFGVDFKDSQSGMWVFKKELLNKLKISSMSNSMPFSEELKIDACHYLKCSWKEVPIKYHKRLGNVKLRTWRNGMENLTYLVKILLRH